MAQPYQSLFLRLLHGINALLILAAIVTGFLVYNAYDQRFGSIPVPTLPGIEGIHGTFGLGFFLAIPAFAIYSFHAGKQRLIQSDSFSRLRQLDRPIGWYSWHRLVNTLMLLAAAFAFLSGRLMKEEWLPAGELNHLAYSLHLMAWVLLVVCLALHLLMAAKVGGAALLRSMIAIHYRPEESPSLWWGRFQGWLTTLKHRSSDQSKDSSGD